MQSKTQYLDAWVSYNINIFFFFFDRNRRNNELCSVCMYVCGSCQMSMVLFDIPTWIYTSTRQQCIHTDWPSGQIFASQQVGVHPHSPTLSVLYSFSGHFPWGIQVWWCVCVYGRGHTAHIRPQLIRSLMSDGRMNICPETHTLSYTQHAYTILYMDKHGSSTYQQADIL